MEKNMIDLIGNTPLIKLKYPSEITGCNIYGKAEFMNPGGSVKDRAAKGIILDAEKNKLIEPGGTVVEGTFGNTGIALAMINNARGYKTIIVMPDGASLEKREILRNLGAELRVVQTKPYSDPGNYQHVSKRLVEELQSKGEGSVVWANQFDNTANFEFHSKTTAREIYDQLEGKIDGFTCAIGTGGTLAGTSIGLKELDQNIKIACSDPQGARMYKYFKDSVLEVMGEPSETEGIGQYRITKNVEASRVDMAYHITDNEAFDLLYKLIKTEGLFLGTSCGVNVAGAIKMGKELGPGKNIVTILCDDAYKYFSKMFSKDFLNSKKLPVPDWI
tara:strand:+ start:4204 stop:5199 length:996 start_codon:yes stop_codon:yes gene_type:complete